MTHLNNIEHRNQLVHVAVEVTHTCTLRTPRLHGIDCSYIFFAWCHPNRSLRDNTAGAYAAVGLQVRARDLRSRQLQPSNLDRVSKPYLPRTNYRCFFHAVYCIVALGYWKRWALYEHHPVFIPVSRGNQTLFSLYSSSMCGACLAKHSKSCASPLTRRPTIIRQNK